MSNCELCGGTLIRRRPRGWPSSSAPSLGAPDEPCPRCLSTPATAEIREVAREWLGFDMWEACAQSGLQPKWGPWWDDAKVAHLPGSLRPILPLYLGAGFDLGVRVLARRGELSPHLVAADLVGNLSNVLRNLVRGGTLSQRRADVIWHWVRAIDAPPNLRAALALKVALEASNE